MRAAGARLRRRPRRPRLRHRRRAGRHQRRRHPRAALRQHARPGRRRRGRARRRLGRAPDGRPAKDGTGYDLVALLAGSEGTLGVVTAVRLRLVPAAARPAAPRCWRWRARRRPSTCCPVLRERLPHLAAAEVFYAEGLALVRRHGGLPAPFAQAGAGLPAARVPRPHRPRPTTWSRSWPRPRASSTPGSPPTPPAVRGAVGLPGGRTPSRSTPRASRSSSTCPCRSRALPGLVAELPDAVARAWPRDALTVLFGHVNEGNLHVNVLGAGERAEQVTDVVLRAVAARGGSISTEHGVGRAKPALAAPVALAGRARRDARGQAGARPAGPAQPRRAARLTRWTRPGALTRSDPRRSRPRNRRGRRPRVGHRQRRSRAAPRLAGAVAVVRLR